MKKMATVMATVAMLAATTEGCMVKTEPTPEPNGGASGSSGGSNAADSNSGGASSGDAGAGDAATQTGGAFAVGDRLEVAINTRAPEVTIPTYGKERGYRFVIELASDKETTITLCPKKGTDTPSNLYLHPEGDESQIEYGAQRTGYDYTGSSLGRFRPKRSGRFVVFASGKESSLRDTGGAYVLSAAPSTDDNDACPR